VTFRPNRQKGPVRTMKRRAVSAASMFLVVTFVLAACGGGDSDSAGGVPSGDAFDRAFIDAMVPHHEAALVMARAAKEAGLSQPDLVQVANDILATQQAEIDQMKQWRGDWYGSSDIDPNGADALGLSESEMGMQHGAEGFENSTQIDTDFAQMMITHHQGAIVMARLAEDEAKHDELKDLAKAIVDAQEREIDVMRPHASGMNHG